MDMKMSTYLYIYISNITREGVRCTEYQHGCGSVVRGRRPSAEDNHSRADVPYTSTTSSVILLLYNSSTSTIN